MNKKEKIVLAYSGGLDTSVLIKWLTNKEFEVIAFLADLGQAKNLKKLKQKAMQCGASKVIVKNLRLEFVEEFIIPTLKAGAVYENGYLLSTALGRPLIAKELVKIAKIENASTVTHGCSAKGNDQIRFEVAISTLAPDIKVIAPLRDWEFKSREEEIAFANENNIPIEANKDSPYSIDKNLWGVSVECGKLENPNIAPPEDVYQITENPEDSPDKPKFISIKFKQGIPIAINSKYYDDKISLINEVAKVGCKYGIGRIDMIEDRVIGIKSREIYETPAATILYTAHKALEALTLTKYLLDFKKIVSDKYAELIYKGLWFTELKESLDRFIDNSQKDVTGEVKLKLYKGNCVCTNRKSDYSLYNKSLATYEKGNNFDHSAAEGFIKIFGLPYRKRNDK